VLPAIVRDHVRPGKLRLVFRGLDFIGDDSTRAARMAAAAGLQNRLYQFVDLVFRNQGAENSGWVTDDYLRRIGEGAGLDVDRAFADRDGELAKAQIRDAKAEGERAKVESTPWFLVQRGREAPRRLEPGALDATAFTAALDEALAGD
jgi:protein-disulfide isomerase